MPCYVKLFALWYVDTTEYDAFCATDVQDWRSQDLTEAVHVIGATGRTGLALCRALAADGQKMVAVVRNPTKWATCGVIGEARMADIDDAASLRRALSDARQVVSTVHARHSAQVMQAAPAARLVLLGSTRRFSRVADAHGSGVLEGERALLASGRHGVMLHPTMIYGGADDATVQRMAAMLRLMPVVPLPGGGRNLVQPIHRNDVVRAIRAALEQLSLDQRAPTPRVVVIAGPNPMSYAAFVQAVAHAAGIGRRLIIPLPVGPLVALSRLVSRLPGWPQARTDEIRRLAEDKAFDITDMVKFLGVTPIRFAEGLAHEFGQTQKT